MIRVTVELLPGGRVPPTTIGTINIANISELADQSDYQVRAISGDRALEILVFRHMRSDGWARLLKRALYSLLDADPKFGVKK